MIKPAGFTLAGAVCQMFTHSAAALDVRPLPLRQERPRVELSKDGTHQPVITMGPIRGEPDMMPTADTTVRTQHASTDDVRGEPASAADAPGNQPAHVSLRAVKQEVVAELGERALLLPAMVNRGLEANERAKYLLALLEAALTRADDPQVAASPLRDERLAAGVTDDALDTVVQRSRKIGDDVYEIPGASNIVAALVAATAEMVAPLTHDTAQERIDADRIERFRSDAQVVDGDQVSGRFVLDLASADPARGDSLHQLVMDAHRALNRLQSEIATEVLDGASVYNLDAADRPLVSSFMTGVRSTAPLKFHHPGLGTTATRTGRRLLIQNDIGQTEGHLVVIGVDGLAVTVTYADVHLRRLEFFQSMLTNGHAVTWSDAQTHRGAAVGKHHLVTGVHPAADDAGVRAFLTHVGSRLVFLIDWNRARKRLTPLVGGRETLELLQWAADIGVGHMAFLELGGERLLYDAIEATASPAHFGETLNDLLGREATRAVCRFALRATAEGLQDGKSPQLIRDELRVELLHHLHTAQATVLEAAAEHAGLIVEAAQTLQTALRSLGTDDGHAFVHRAAQRAAAWEHHADEIVRSMRASAQRVQGAETMAELLTSSDDAIDDLEEALFLLTVLPAEAQPTTRVALDSAAGIAVNAARENLKAQLIAREIVDGRADGDLEDFLVAVDRVMLLEHDADAADRLARATLLSQAPDFRSLYVADLVSRGIEDTTDALMRSCLGLRDYILSGPSIR